MKNVTLRLIYPGTLAREHVKAAEEGLEPFNRFKALVESAPASERAFVDVRLSNPLRRVVNADGDIRVKDLLRDAFSDGSNIFGIALTPNFLIDTDGETVSAIGGYMASAAVSLAAPMRLPDPGPAITALVRYQASQLLIPAPEGQGAACPNECLMQETSDFSEFFQLVVFPGIDLCRDCAAAIKSTIMRLSHGMN